MGSQPIVDSCCRQTVNSVADFVEGSDMAEVQDIASEVANPGATGLLLHDQAAADLNFQALQFLLGDSLREELELFHQDI